MTSSKCEGGCSQAWRTETCWSTPRVRRRQRVYRPRGAGNERLPAGSGPSARSPSASSTW
eukprot:6815665-Prymnesium_polylepis.1